MAGTSKFCTLTNPSPVGYYFDVNNNTDGLKKSSFLPVLIIATLAIGLYLNTLKNGFVYDDADTIVNNILIKNFHNLPTIFKKDYLDLSGEMSYRPVVTISYFLDYAVFGLSPWGFHLTNILLHSLNGVVLYMFLVLLIKAHGPHAARSIPLVGSLLFIGHPVLTEPVNAISFREDLLTFFFYISALSIYLVVRRSFTYPLYIVSCIFYFFALLSKEMAITFPLIICCYEWVYRGKENRGILLVNRYLGYLVISFAYVYLRFYHFYNPATENYAKWDIMERLFTLPWLLASYLKLTVFPISLSAYYDIVPIKFSTFPFVISFLIVALSIFFAFMLRKKEKRGSFGTFFFFITLIPVYNLVHIIHPFAERYLYLPLAGVIIATLSIFGPISKCRNYFIVFFIVVFCIFSLVVINRNKVWQSDFSLWADTVIKMPDSNFVHLNIGTVFSGQGRFDEAIREFKIALGLKPNYPPAFAHNELGYAYFKVGEIEAAEQEFNIALKQNPAYSTPYNNLGIIHTNQGKLDKAIKEFESALKSKPFDPKFYYNLGVTYEKSGRLDDAILQYKTYLKFMPDDYYIHYSLGMAYMKKGLKDKSLIELETALKMRPDFFPALQAFEDLRRSR